GSEDISEGEAKFVKIATKTGQGAYFFVELLARQEAQFIAEEQGRSREEAPQFLGGHSSTRRDSAHGDGVIKVHEDFAEIEDDDFRKSHRLTENTSEVRVPRDSVQ